MTLRNGHLHSQPCTANDTINLRIVGGLLCVGALIVLGSIGLLFMGKPIPETMMVMAGNIFAGLIGYLSRTADPSSKHTAVTTGSVETVNVEAGAVEGEPVAAQPEKPAGGAPAPTAVDSVREEG